MTIIKTKVAKHCQKHLSSLGFLEILRTSSGASTQINFLYNFTQQFTLLLWISYSVHSMFGIILLDRDGYQAKH